MGRRVPAATATTISGSRSRAVIGLTDAAHRVTATDLTRPVTAARSGVAGRSARAVPAVLVARVRKVTVPSVRVLPAGQRASCAVMTTRAPMMRRRLGRKGRVRLACTGRRTLARCVRW